MTTTAILEGELHAAADDPARIDADLPAPSVQSHAANLMVLPNRDLGCVWFGGTQEGLSDISVWFSRLPHGTSQWTTPVKLSDDPTRSEQNPILFPAPDGRLWLLHTAQKSGNQDTALVRYRISEDNGLTWRPTGQLFDDARRVRTAAGCRPGQRGLAAGRLSLSHGARGQVGRQQRRQRGPDLDGPGQKLV